MAVHCIPHPRSRVKMEPVSWTKSYLSLIYLVLVCESSCEVIIKESKVDPFSLILNNQRDMMVKIDFIFDQIKSMNDLETKLSSLQMAVDTTNSKMAITNHNINILSEGLKNLSSDIHTMTQTHLVSDTDDTILKSNHRNPCYEMVPIFKNGVNDILKCNSVLSYHPKEPETEIYSKKNPREVENRDDVYKNTDNILNAKHVNRTDNYNTSVNVKNDCRMPSENKLSELESLINRNSNTTNEQLIRILSLIHNIEYRQHVSTITQDRRLNTLLHKMSAYQTVLEDRIADSLNSAFKDDRQHLEDELKEIKDRFKNEDRLFYGLFNVANDLSQTIKNLTLTPSLSSESNHSDSCLNSSNSLQDFDVINDLTRDESPSRVNKTISDFHPQNISFISTNFSSVDGESSDTAVGNNVPLLLGLHFAVPSNNKDEKVSEEVQKIQELETVHPNDHVKVVNNLNEHVIKKQEEISLDEEKKKNEQSSVDRIVDLVNEQIQNIESMLERKMGEAEDKMTGLRIHQTSSMYSQTKEIRYEMEKLEKEIAGNIQSIGNGIEKKLEATRKSLFTFIDAAVTSLSSATVTSSQSTGMFVAKELRSAMKDIGKKITESNIIKKEIVGCPEMYRRVGESCFLVLSEVGTTWRNGCKLCKMLGGNLAYIPLRKDIKTLTEILRLPPSDGFWIGKMGMPSEDLSCDLKSETEEKEELTNSVVTSDIKKDFNDFQNGTRMDCSVLDGDNFEIKSASCIETLGVICQYSLSSYFPEKKLVSNETSLIDRFVKDISYTKNNFL